MKKVFTKSLAIAITLSMVSLLLPIPAIAVSQLTNNVINENAPQINSAGKAVWSAADGTINNDTEIFYYNGTSVVQLTDNTADDTSPVINNNGAVAWLGTGAAGGDTDAFYNSTGAATGNTEIPDATNVAEEDLAITVNSSNNNVVALVRNDGTDDEVLRSIDGAAPTAVTADDTGVGIANDDGEVQAAGNNIIYTKTDGTRRDVYLYNGSTNTQLTTNNASNFDEASPVVDSTGKSAWLTGLTADGTIWINSEIFYNGTGVATGNVQITSNAVTEINLGIDSGQLVWEASDGNDAEIYFNGTGTAVGTKKITSNGVDDENPVISAASPAKVIYDGFRRPASDPNNGDYEVFLYNSANSSTIQVTDDTNDEMNPDINGNKVAWRFHDGSDYEIVTDTITASTLSLRAKPSSIKRGRGTILLGTLKNAAGKRLANKKIKIKAGNALIAQVTTNKKGEYKKTLKKVQKSKNLKAYFDGSGTALKSWSKTTKLKVKK